MLMVIWTIIVIEMTIAYNGMSEINQLVVTSQLIPFVVGLGLILTVLHRLFFEYADPKKVSLHRAPKPRPSPDPPLASVRSGTRPARRDARAADLLP